MGLVGGKTLFLILFLFWDDKVGFRKVDMGLGIVFESIVDVDGSVVDVEEMMN